MSADERSSKSRVARVVAGATAIVVLLGYVLNLFYDWNPSLKPDPGTHLSASVRSISVEPAVSVRSYLAEVSNDHISLRRAEDSYVEDIIGIVTPTAHRLDCERQRKLNHHGWVVYANLTVEGLKRRKVALSTTLYHADTGRREPEYSERFAPHQLQSPSDRFVEVVFIDRPPVPGGLWFVRLELRNVSDGAVLAFADSPTFEDFSIRTRGNPLPCQD